MKRLFSGVVAVSLTLVVLVGPAQAHHRGHVAAGVVAGGISGGHVTHGHRPRGHFATRPVVVFPAPIFVLGPVYYPAATCWDFWVNAYWSPGTVVPGHWERVCR